MQKKLVTSTLEKYGISRNARKLPCDVNYVFFAKDPRDIRIDHSGHVVLQEALVPGRYNGVLLEEQATLFLINKIGNHLEFSRPSIASNTAQVLQQNPQSIQLTQQAVQSGTGKSKEIHI